MKTCKYYKSSSNFPSNCFGQSLVRSVRWTDQYGQLETLTSWRLVTHGFLRPVTNEHSDLSKTFASHFRTDKEIIQMSGKAQDIPVFDSKIVRQSDESMSYKSSSTPAS